MKFKGLVPRESRHTQNFQGQLVDGTKPTEIVCKQTKSGANLPRRRSGLFEVAPV